MLEVLVCLDGRRREGIGDAKGREESRICSCSKAESVLKLELSPMAEVDNGKLGMEPCLGSGLGILLVCSSE